MHLPPADTGRKLNVHSTVSLRLVSTGPVALNTIIERLSNKWQQKG